MMEIYIYIGIAIFITLHAVLFKALTLTFFTRHICPRIHAIKCYVCMCEGHIYERFVTLFVNIYYNIL